MTVFADVYGHNKKKTRLERELKEQMEKKMTINSLMHSALIQGLES